MHGCAVQLLAGCGTVSRTPEPDTARPVLTVGMNDSVVLTAADDRAVPLRVVYPEAGGRWPLIACSHGMFSSNAAGQPISPWSG